MRKWTDEEKQKQAEAIRKWKPWEQSTGPKSEKGKKKTRYNSLKHGARSREFEELNSLLSLHSEFMHMIEAELKTQRLEWEKERNKK